MQPAEKIVSDQIVKDHSTDIYQEQNGIYTFERSPKFDLDRIRRIQQRPAAIEQAALSQG